ncbi:MAG: hypothetical protein IJ437_01280 [Clostridia bacterium]|nr:hypothetical protein [Clostridia bacterium]
MKIRILKIACVFLALIFVFPIIGCGEKDAIKLSFKSTSTYGYLKSIDGKTVTINGYMATSSPVDGSFMFLMNMPYQSCPFCVPNTSQLSNTLEVYPKKGKAFDYTTQAIKVVGTLMVAQSEDEFFTDEFGYEFNFKIVDAEYTILSADEISADLALWQEIAESNIVTEIDKMYQYVNFLCAWNTYYVKTYINEAGEVVKGYYLYPSDALNYITIEGASYYYGYKNGYFDGLVQKIEAVDKDKLSSLVENVRKAEVLSQKALNELNSKNYTSEFKYLEEFDNYDYVYTLDKGEELTSEMDLLYKEFSAWISSWEM